MKKSFLTGIIILSVLALAATLFNFAMPNFMGPIYAYAIGKVIGSRNIEKTDMLFDDNSLIVYYDKENEYIENYKDTRTNVINAFKDEEFPNVSSYSIDRGEFYSVVEQMILSPILNSGDKYKILPYGRIEINVYIHAGSDRYDNDMANLIIERTVFGSYRIEKLESGDDFFGYLFFGMEK